MIRNLSLAMLGWLSIALPAMALPVGYQKTTVALNAPPSGLTYTPGGTLYAFEAPAFMDNTAVVRVINSDLSFGIDLNVTGLDTSLFIGGMAFDPVTGGVLITDNAGGGSLYSLSSAGTQVNIFSNVPNVAGVAVRSTGEIFVSTAPFAAGQGKVFQVNRATGATTEVLSGLDYGAGLTFDNAGNLIVQDADLNSFTGRLQRLPIAEDMGNLVIGLPEFLISGMTAGAGVAVDSEGDIFATGPGGLYEVTGGPLAASSFDFNGNPNQFSTAIAFLNGNAPFEPFAGGTSRLAYLSDFGFDPQFVSNFVTIISPVPEPASAAMFALGMIGALRLARQRGMYGVK